MAGRPKGSTEIAATRRQEAFELRRQGLSYRDIGARLSVSHVTAYRHVTATMAELRAKTLETAEEVRDLELARLDAFVESLWPKRDDERVVRVLVQAMDQRAKLLGLYPKATVGVEGSEGGAVTVTVVHHYEETPSAK